MNYYEQGQIVARSVNRGDKNGAQSIMRATFDPANVYPAQPPDAYDDYSRGYHSESHETRLAIAFRDGMRAALSADELATIDAANDECRDSGTCASHDLTDPNQFMIEALASIGLELNLEDERQITLINDVWDAVRHTGFSYRVLYAATNDDGEKEYPVLGFSTAVGGDYIYAAATSECGRFRVDPIGYYGLTPEQVEQMHAFNGLLYIY